ncbi:MAG: DUF2169 domain-containing protein [Holophagales bacterium]|nr:DUF2169 domain-containing protein [Holophagales bacterium]
MKLENGTTLAAHLFSGPADETNLGCALLLTATYEIRERGLEPATEALWPVHLEPLETPYGTFPGEIASRKPKTDVLVLGKAKAPGGEAVRQMTVSVSVGSFRNSLAVFGDRRWERSAGGLRATEPLAFREMPIVWANAYGGKLTTPVGDMPNTDNPVGKGFFLDDREGDGVPLPNVEDPGALIRSPKDLPKPVGWAPYPMAGGVRMAKLRDADGIALPAEVVEPWIMGWAHPDLIIETPAAGTRIEVQGLSAGGPIATTVPPLPARATLVLGEESRSLSPRLDTIIVQAEERRLVVRWRAATTFEMRPREVRLVRIEPA